MTAPAVSTGSRPISNRSKAQRIAKDSSDITTKPSPMSKLCQSTQLEEYTASMRNYLAIVESARSPSPKRARMSATESAESSGSSSGSERERSPSPEFRWMDLANVRKEHGSVDLAGLANGHRRLKTMAGKQAHRRTGFGNGKENGHAREHRSPSPRRKPATTNRQFARAAHSPPYLPDMGIASAEKNCIE